MSGVLWFIGLVTVLSTAGALAGQLFEASATSQGTFNAPPIRLWPQALRLRAVSKDLEQQGMRITSLYRDDETNERVNGAAGSLHKEARALDGVVDSPENRPRVVDRLRQLRDAGLVSTWDEHDKGSGMHLHVELRPDDP